MSHKIAGKFEMIDGISDQTSEPVLNVDIKVIWASDAPLVLGEVRKPIDQVNSAKAKITSAAIEHSIGVEQNHCIIQWDTRRYSTNR